MVNTQNLCEDELQEEHGGEKELQKIPVMQLRIMILIYCYVQWQLLLYWKEKKTKQWLQLFLLRCLFLSFDLLLGLASFVS